MAESTLTDVDAFEPLIGGGRGVRVAFTTTSSRAEIPGTQAVGKVRVKVSNGTFVSAWIAFGQSNIVATVGCLEILPGCDYVFTAPAVSPTALWVAGITESGTAKLTFNAGRGY